jgi:hypothetical protein
VVIAGCSGPAASLPDARSSTAQPSIAIPQTATNAPCKAFDANFHALVACQRAEGTLHSFASSNIAWRVRYFVRYMAMPCDEAPTVEEAYVFHMVVDDLNNDPDLSAADRADIRAAMFFGKVHCT